MKILHVVQGYFPGIGGTELAIQRISEGLVQQFGDQVTVFTTNCYSGEAFNRPELPRMPSGREEINGVHIYRFPVMARLSRIFKFLQVGVGRFHLPGNQYWRTYYQGPIIPQLTRYIEKADVDLVSASSFPLLHMFQALKGSKRSNKPCILFGGIHPHDDWGFQRPMIYKAIAEAEGYIANTKYEADYVVERGANIEKVSVGGLGTDAELFTQIPYDLAKRKIGLDKTIPLVGFIGQLGWHKGVDTLLNAMPKVWESIPNAHLLIAGAKTSFSESIENFINTLDGNQRKQIILKYNFPEEEKPWLFNAIDVFAYPSGYESFGISFVEAWAAKKPVIGCWSGAIPWVVHPGKDGLLIPFRDTGLLAESIISMLKNPYYASQLGLNGFMKVNNYYNWTNATERYRDIYQKVLDNYHKH